MNHNDPLRCTTACCGICWLLCCCGCGTVANLREHGQRDPYVEGKANYIHFRGLDPGLKPPSSKTVYGGVRYDLYLNSIYSHGSDIYPIYGWFALCDVPLSFVADTAVLPLTLLKQSSTTSEPERNRTEQDHLRPQYSEVGAAKEKSWEELENESGGTMKILRRNKETGLLEDKSGQVHY